MRRMLQRIGQVIWTSMALATLMLAGLPAAAWDRGNLADYHERRARLVRDTGGSGVIVMFGYRESDVAASTTPFRQNENFYYLTGWNEPEALMMVIPKVAKGSGNQSAEIDQEILFIPAHDYRQEKWTGPKLGPEDGGRARAPVSPPSNRFHCFNRNCRRRSRTSPGFIRS
jgi:Xaa-Pro aminopeptidase